MAGRSGIDEVLFRIELLQAQPVPVRGPRRLESSCRQPPPDPTRSPVARVVVDVMLKPEILDPQGQAVAQRAAPPRLRPASPTSGRASASSSRSTARSTEARLAADPRASPRPCSPTRSSRTSRPGRGAELELTARIGVVTFPGSLDDRDAAARRPRSPAAEPVAALARRRRPARRRRGGAARRLLLRRLPALRRDRPVRAGHGAARRRRPQDGLPVLGICNGFQVLCESHLLPGALIRNDHRTSSAATSGCAIENAATAWTTDYAAGPGDRRSRSRTARAASSPTSATLDALEGEGRVVARYARRQPQRLLPRHRRHHQRARQRRRPDAAPRARRRGR